MPDLRLIDRSRTGNHFETWQLTDRFDIKSAQGRGDAPRCRGHSPLEASGLRAAGRLFSSDSGSGAPLL